MRTLNKNPDTGQISVTNGGLSASFPDDATFNLYYPILDLTGKTELSYQVDRARVAIHIDRAAQIHHWLKEPTPAQRDAIRVPEYEVAINAAAQMVADQNDQFWGVDLATAKTLKRRSLKAEGIEHFQQKWDYLEMAKMTRSGADKTEFDADYDATVAAFIAARNAVNAAGDVAAVKAVTANWPAI